MLRPILITLVLLCMVTPQAYANLPIRCFLTDNKDHFLFYPEQQVYRSEQFVIFQNFKGRVVSQIDLKTGKFSRTTYIGEPFSPQYQILFGSCNKPNHVLNMWHMNSVPLDQR